MAFLIGREKIGQEQGIALRAKFKNGVLMKVNTEIMSPDQVLERKG